MSEPGLIDGVYAGRGEGSGGGAPGPVEMATVLDPGEPVSSQLQSELTAEGVRLRKPEFDNWALEVDPTVVISKVRRATARAETGRGNEGFTIAFAHYVSEAKQHEFREWIKETSEEAKRFEGYITTVVLEPSTVNPNFISIQQWATVADAERFKYSDVRARRVDLLQVDGIAERPFEVRTCVGSLPFMQLPEIESSYMELTMGTATLGPAKKAPPAWKMILISWIGVYLLVLGVNFAVEFVPVIMGLHPYLRVAVVTINVVILMNRVYMPLSMRMARLLRFV